MLVSKAHRRGSHIPIMFECEPCPRASDIFPKATYISNPICGDFRCFWSDAHKQAPIKPILFKKAPYILPWCHLTLRALFIFFILRQEYLRGVCTVSPQIKHSPCIPYEMYLLRFGRGGRQVLGYINSEFPPLPIRRGHGQAPWVTGSSWLCFYNKSREMCCAKENFQCSKLDFR